MPDLTPCPRCRQPAQLFDQPPSGVWAACPTKCWIGPVCTDAAQAAEAWNEMAAGLELLHAVGRLDREIVDHRTEVAAWESMAGYKAAIVPTQHQINSVYITGQRNTLAEALIALADELRRVR